MPAKLPAKLNANALLSSADIPCGAGGLLNGKPAKLLLTGVAGAIGLAEANLDPESNSLMLSNKPILSSKAKCFTYR